MAADWSAYQEEAAQFFRSLGLEAFTNVSVRGVRTSHDIDVLVRSHHAGFDVTWLVECKHWNTRVSKLHVLALREIVADTGTDRGILLAEKGFQSGATEAAALTNVHLGSLAAAREAAAGDLIRMRLSEYFDRVEKAKELYWSFSKETRIKYDLRPDLFESGYWGANVIALAEDLLRKGVRANYPFEIDYALRHSAPGLPEAVQTARDLLEYLESIVDDLERRLAACSGALAAAEERVRGQSE